MKYSDGFTLAELLVALAILGVIATFTIPKVLQAQQSEKSKAVAKETASMISGAFQQMQFQGKLTGSTSPSELTPYLNYVKIDTSGTLIDAPPNWAGTAGGGLCACDSSNPCLTLHNGGVLWLNGGKNFGGQTPNNAIGMALDPDGVGTGGTADGNGKSVQFILYYNGFLTTRGQARASTRDSDGCCWGPLPTLDPSWFNWD